MRKELMRRLILLLSIACVVFLVGWGCAYNGKLYDATALRKTHVGIDEELQKPHAQIGQVYQVTQDMLLHISTRPRGMYALVEFGYSYDPPSPEAYYASPRRWPTVAGVVREGTCIRGVRVVGFQAPFMSSHASWIGVVYEVRDGEHAGKVLKPMVPAFSTTNVVWGVPNPKYLRRLE